MRDWIAQALMLFDLGVLAYFLVLNALYLLFSVIALVALARRRRRWTPRALDVVMRSPATPAISVIAPAYNEEATIEQSVRALLLLNYPRFEVVVVNDGSKDKTVETVVELFGLMKAPIAYQQPIVTKEVRALYRSLDNPDLVLIDKDNGGKADAMNAGINAARYPLVCVIDADSILEPDALLRAVLPFVESPHTIASGGIIRIVNDCHVEAGRVTEVAMPRNWLARFQVVEYLRAFLSGRVATSAINALLIISGAFGLFRRDAVIEVGGFRHDTIGEDMEIVTRLHRHWRDSGRPYNIVFQPDPVCWTEAPESLKTLAGQRNRWQRGTCQVLSYHLSMLMNPKYGSVGLFALPYFLIFEAIGPVIEVAGYIVTAIAVAFGMINVVFAQLLFLAAVAFGAIISLLSVVLEEVSFRRYPKVRHILLLAATGVLENLGYRQLTTYWRMRGIIDFLRKKQGWGTMTRKGFAKT